MERALGSYVQKTGRVQGFGCQEIRKSDTKGTLRSEGCPSLVSGISYPTNSRALVLLAYSDKKNKKTSPVDPTTMLQKAELQTRESFCRVPPRTMSGSCSFSSGL